MLPETVLSCMRGSLLENSSGLVTESLISYFGDQVTQGCVVRREALQVGLWLSTALLSDGSGLLGGCCGCGQPGCGWADPGYCHMYPAPAVPYTLPRPLYVTVVYQGKCSHCMRIGVAVPISGTVARLREAVSSETKIPTEQVRSCSSPMCSPTAGSLEAFIPCWVCGDGISVEQQKQW